MGKYLTALINLPGFYNPDSEGKRLKVEEDKFENTATEISLKFGGGCWHPGKTGIWWDKGVRYVDPEMRIFEVDIPDTEADKSWLVNYIRDSLLSRFKQETIYLKIVPTVVEIYEIRIAK